MPPEPRTSGNASREGRPSLAWLARPGLLLAAGVVLGVASLHLWIDPSNPPGFHRDEASIAYNASTISTSLRDEHGGLLPLYIESFGDYKSPVFVYALAGLFRLTGPSSEVARGLGAVGVLAAVLLLALLAFRRTRDVRVAAAVAALGGLSPWLFELGRVAVEVTLEPLVLVVLLLVLEDAWRRNRWGVTHGVAAGALLALLAYTYAGARLLAPLLAASLLVFARRERLRSLGAAWATFAVLLMPLIAYAVRHPGALSARFHHTTFVKGDMSDWEVVRTFVGNYLTDISLWSYVTGGDPKPHIHIAGTGMLLATGVALAAAGSVLSIRVAREDRWAAFVLLATILVPIPAALTADRMNGYRLALLPIMLVVLAIPALEALVQWAARDRRALVVAGALTAVALVQFAGFLSTYHEKGGFARAELYEAGVPALLAQAFANGAAVHMDLDEPRAHAHARWYAATHDISQDRVVVLSDGGVPPDGSIVFGRAQACDFECREFARSDTYWLARARVPN
ncbi:MAG TPA: hypothetical protein VEW11_02490 [Gaiellaceae bacterium]|nr:hypothetical protein [Gaiellaceae bacterium]